MKLGIKLGKFLNEYIKSYGSWTIDFTWLIHLFKRNCVYTHLFWPRRSLVHFICSALAQIDEEEYRKCRSTIGYKFLIPIPKVEVI